MYIQFFIFVLSIAVFDFSPIYSVQYIEMEQEAITGKITEELSNPTSYIPTTNTAKNVFLK